VAGGTFWGFLTGIVVSGVVAGAVSLVSPPPDKRVPEATALDVPAGSEFNQSREDREAELPATEPTPEEAGAPRVAAPEADDLSALEDADTAPAGQPETGGAEGALDAPAAGDANTGVAVESESPVLPSPQAMVPDAPAGEEDLSISTEPAQPVQPDIETESGAFTSPETDPGAEAAPEADTVPETEAVPETEPAPAAETAPETEPASDADAAPEDAQMPEAESPDAADSAPEVVEMPEEADVPEVVDAPDVADVPEVDSPDDASPGMAESEDAPEGVAEAEPEAGEEEETAPSGTIDNLATGVTTDRLPSLRAEPEAEATDTPEATQEGEAPEVEDTRPPVERFAAPFENPEGKPLMSIVLIDDGSGPVGPEVLADFPYPVSLAVDASWDGALLRARAYRAAGLEVLALADLPANATARDTEVAMQAFLNAVPEAVAVMEAPGEALQSNRAASQQLADILLDSGHGLLMFPEGLNTAQQLAAKSGVPSASVFRDFDDQGQDGAVIRRFLDQAAFRAGQEENGVIMVGRLRPDTISALLLWGLQDRASRVALAPVSAVLLAE